MKCYSRSTLALLLVPLLFGGCLPAVFTPNVVVDSQIDARVREVDYRDRSLMNLQLMIATSVAFGPTDQFMFYLGDEEYRAETGRKDYVVPHENLPRDGEVRLAGYRLYSQEGELITQDEVEVKLIF